MNERDERRPDDLEMDFWQRRYLAGQIPWDLGAAPAALTQWLASRPAPGTVLIPGCGSGYEVRAFHAASWDIVALDYAPAAVARARGLLGSLADKVILADFFTHDFGETVFDLIYERTFLCTIPPPRWLGYINRMQELLTHGGLLAGIFLFGREDDPPPYPLTVETQNAVFTPAFECCANEPVLDSAPLFVGQERWQVWEKRGGPSYLASR